MIFINFYAAYTSGARNRAHKFYTNVSSKSVGSARNNDFESWSFLYNFNHFSNHYLMIIEPAILESFGAKTIEIHKNEILFPEGGAALFYYQVDKGIIKMNNYSEDGQEFVQGSLKMEKALESLLFLQTFLILPMP